MPDETIQAVDARDADTVWRLHGDAAMRLATVLVGPNDAHDVAVSGFLNALASPGWSKAPNLRGYLLRAVSYATLDYRRQRSRRWKRDLLAVAGETSTAPESTVDLRRAVAALSVQQRTVVYFAYWEDMTEAAIADLLQLSIGTVHRNLSRARQHLRKALE